MGIELFVTVTCQFQSMCHLSYNIILHGQKLEDKFMASIARQPDLKLNLLLIKTTQTGLTYCINHGRIMNGK